MSFRSKNALISFVFITLCLLFLNIARFSGFVLYGSIVFIMLVYYFLLYWLLNFDVSVQGFITILLLPTITLGAYMLIYYNFIRDLAVLYRIVFTFVFIVLQYYLVLTQNILNLSYFTNVGLSQAALVANNFYTILSFFFVNLSIFLIPEVNIPFKMLFTIVMFVIFYLIFILINNIEVLQYYFGIFFYSIAILIYIIMYISGFINPISSLLTSIVFSIVFRGITVIALYSFRRVISFFDYLQVVFEAALIAFLIFMSSL